MTLYEVITVVLVEADSEEEALERESNGMGELQEWTAQPVHVPLACGHSTEPPGPKGTPTGRAWCPECGESRTVLNEED